MRAALALLVVLPAFTGTAHGASVQAHPTSCDSLGDCVASVSFEAGPGEANDVRVEVDRRGVVVRDGGAEVSARAPCVSLAPRAARCPLRRERGTSRFVTVRAGDGDDAVAIVDAPGGAGARPEVALGDGDDRYSGGGAAQGEAGDDVLRSTGSASFDGGAGADTLAGGAGDDDLRGGPGPDVLRGVAGDDVLNAGDGGTFGPTPDHVDGGAGRDTLSYAGAPHGVRVDLAAPGPQGGRRERDAVAGIEDAEGGFGPDRLFGDRAGNRLSGGYGSDLIAGRGGDDLLVGFSESGGLDHDREARDVVYGGAGADRLMIGPRGADSPLEPRPPAPSSDVAVCGAGDDVVAPGEGIGAVARGCERWSVTLWTRSAEVSLPPRPGRRTAMAVPCPKQPRGSGGHCRVRGLARGPGGHVLARDAGRARPGRPVALSLAALPRRGGRLELEAWLIDPGRPAGSRIVSRTGLAVELAPRRRGAARGGR